MEKEFIGTEKLERGQISDLKDITSKYLVRIKRIVGNVKSVEVRIKTYHDEGKAREYSINTSIVLKVRKFESDSEGWDFNSTLREGFEKIIEQLKHEFHK